MKIHNEVENDVPQFKYIFISTKTKRCIYRLIKFSTLHWQYLYLRAAFDKLRRGMDGMPSFILLFSDLFFKKKFIFSRFKVLISATVVALLWIEFGSSYTCALMHMHQNATLNAFFTCLPYLENSSNKFLLYSDVIKSVLLFGPKKGPQICME